MKKKDYFFEKFLQLMIKIEEMKIIDESHTTHILKAFKKDSNYKTRLLTFKYYSRMAGEQWNVIRI